MCERVFPSAGEELRQEVISRRAVKVGAVYEEEY